MQNSNFPFELVDQQIAFKTIAYVHACICNTFHAVELKEIQYLSVFFLIIFEESNHKVTLGAPWGVLFFIYPSL